MSNKVAVLVILFVEIFSLHNAVAQTEDYDVFQLRYLYNEIKFAQVISKGNSLLKNRPGIPREHLQEIHKYLALAYYNTGHQDSSRAHFYTLLSLSPDFELDPVQTSPKILDFFQAIKSAFSSDQQQKTAVPYTEYVFLSDARPQAGLRSLVIPGWGQYFKSQKKRGLIFGSAFFGVAGATGVTYFLEKNRRTAYGAERNPQRVAAKYDAYNNMSKTRRLLQYTAAAIWTTALLDALFSKYNPNLQVDKESVGLAIQLRF